MKTLLLTLSLLATIVSGQAQANGGQISAGAAAITLSPLLPFVASTALTGMLSTDTNVHKQAEQIIKDGQEYLQTGEMTVLISQKVEQLQEEADMSDDEAVDALMNQASDILK